MAGALKRGKEGEIESQQRVGYIGVSAWLGDTNGGRRVNNKHYLFITAFSRPMFSPEKITDILARKKFTTSAEVFPPRNGKPPQIILDKLAKLKELAPDFISITKGAMGSQRGGTVPIGYMISERYEMNALVHFRCRDLDKREVENQLIDNLYFGIKNILAVLGDPIPGETERELDSATQNRYASELVSQISDMNEGKYLPLYGETEPRKGIKTDVCIGVAGYPEAEDMEKEFFIIGEKVRAGADFIITQMVFDADIYSNYVGQLRERGIKIPVIPGVRPVTTPSHVQAAEDIFGANVPNELKNRLASCPAGEAKETCVNFTVDLCQRLRDVGAPGVHLFILNDVDIATEIISRF